MRVIVAVDAIFPPLTGIGRYAAELAAGLGTHPEVEQLRFFLHGRFVEQPGAATGATDGAQPAASRGAVPVAARLRARLGQSRLAVRGYAALQPKLAAWRLRACRDHLFHSPNFLLPPYPGPSVATIHDLSTQHYPEYHPAARVELMRDAVPRAAERATALITPSEAVRSEVIDHLGVPAGRVHCIPMGVDPAYAPRAPELLQERLAPLGLTPGTYLLCVATLEPRKNIDRLLDAYAQLPSSLRKRYPLVLAGGRGWHSDDLCNRIERLEAKGQVRPLGYVSEQHLPALYAGARLFAFPALYEGFGLPVLEAMASGVPVVTSDCSSMPEVAGGAALLVDPLRAAAISDGLQRGLEDDGWRGQAVAAGLERARQLTWSRCVDTTVTLYESLNP